MDWLNFTVTLFIDWLMQPMGIVFSCLLVALLVGFRQGFAFSRAALLSSVLVLWFSSTPISANWLVKQVEPATPEVSCATDITSTTPVVVLGGALHAYISSDNPYEVLSRDSLQRTLHAAKLDKGENPFYVLGGGVTSRKLAHYMELVLMEQGIDSTRITKEQRSLSTLGNARELSTVLPPTFEPAIILVTSQLHLKRAESAFESQGYSVCGVGVGSLYAPSAGWVGWLPYAESLLKSTLAWREMLASNWYQLRYNI